MTTPRSWFSYGLRLIKDEREKLHEQIAMLEAKLQDEFVRQALKLTGKKRTFKESVTVLGDEACAQISAPFRREGQLLHDKRDIAIERARRGLMQLAPLCKPKVSKSYRLWRSIEGRKYTKLATERGVNPAHLARAEAELMADHARRYEIPVRVTPIANHKPVGAIGVVRYEVVVRLAEKLDVLILEHQLGAPPSEFIRRCAELDVDPVIYRPNITQEIATCPE